MIDLDKIEAALRSEKEELDELNAKIRTLKNELDELKPTVRRYNDLKHEQADLTKMHRAKFNLFRIRKDFIEGVAGTFVDGIYPLFSSENRATVSK